MLKTDRKFKVLFKDQLQQEERWLVQAEELIIQSLAAIPTVQLQRVSRADISQGVNLIADVCVGESLQETQYRLLILVKPLLLFPQRTLELLDSSQNTSNIREYPILISPFINATIANTCIEQGIGYLDFAGNCHLAFGNIYVHIEGKKNPSRREITLRTLFSPKAERLLRVLLNHPQSQSWKTQPLATEARVSLGLVTYVRKELEQQELIEDTQTGFRLTRPEVLLKLWADNYARRDADKIGEDFLFYGLVSSPTEVEQKVIAATLEPGHFSFTGITAANHLAPYTRSPRVTAYVAGEKLETVTEQLGLQPVETGANVVLTVPKDAGVFYGARRIDGVPVASPVQIYLDLYRLGGRTREGAEVIRTEVLEPLWQSDSQPTN